MDISSLVSANAADAQAAAAKAKSSVNSLNYDDFISLLISELKHQDPTQPMDPSQMVSQLATISQVGQAVQTNTTLASLLTSTSLSQAEALIGRTVTSSDGVTSGTVAAVSVTATGVTALLTNGKSISLADGAIVQ